ncbi:MAG TPA: META domain-containing protein [Usitatibacter sp.]|nr:META domain-containing protein [Usitatibacter sp.]
MNRAIILATVAFFAAACESTAQKEPPPKPFVGTHWRVVLDLPLKGEQPNMRFGDGRVEGFGGCSKFSAGIIEDSIGAGALVIRKIQVDKRICDPGDTVVEDRLLEKLQTVQSYKILGDAMQMVGPGGSIKLIAVP